MSYILQRGKWANKFSSGFTPRQTAYHRKQNKAIIMTQTRKRMLNDKEMTDIRKCMKFVKKMFFFENNNEGNKN